MTRCTVQCGTYTSHRLHFPIDRVHRLLCLGIQGAKTVQDTLGKGRGGYKATSQTQPTGILVRLSSPGYKVPHWAAATRLSA